MSFTSSQWLDSLCLNLRLFNASLSYYQVTLTTCVITSLLAPMTMIANAFILAAIWKNPSLRTPSYVLLAGLAFTDFCTGLLTQPFYVLNKLGEMTGRVDLSCIALHCTALGYYLNPFMF